MSRTHFNQINNDLKKWLIASQKLRRSASICYGKIKSAIAAVEPISSRSVMDKFHDETGKLILKKILIYIFMNLYDESRK